MILIFFILWMITVILLCSDPKNTVIRWAAFFTFCSGCGGFGRVIIETFIPYLNASNLVSFDLEPIGYRLHAILSFINQTGFPYGFLMFSIYYSDILNKNRRRLLAAVLAMPIIGMLIITPFTPRISFNFNILLTWVVLYVLAGTFFLYKSYVNEQRQVLKRNRLLTMWCALPPVYFNLISDYFLRAFHVEDVWRWNWVIIIFLLIAFLFIITTQGILGFRLRFEKQVLSDTMKALYSGTSILNHSIKTELCKIDILSEQIKYDLESRNSKETILESMNLIHLSTSHLLQMTTRIQQQMQDIVLDYTIQNARDLVENALILIQPLLQSKQVSIYRDYSYSENIWCDAVHMQETLTNILINAIEAMDEESKLTVRIFQTKNKVNIQIEDTGSGISQENMPHIYTPFFSTKNKKQNYGLGLAYCYNVVTNHLGSLTFSSEKDKGTIATISLPHHNTKKEREEKII